MTLVITIDILVLIVLFGIALIRGLEAALPFVTFVLILVPDQSQIHLPGAFDLTTQRVVIITLLALYFVLHRRRSGAMRMSHTPLLWLMLAQVIWASLSTANSIVPLISLKKLLSETIEYYVLYFIFTHTVTQPRTINKILHAMVSAIIICCIFGGLQAYTGWAVTNLFPAEAEGPILIAGGEAGRGLRIWSTFPHPILFGVAIAVVVPITLYLLSTAKNPLRKTWLWTGIMLMFLSIYKTSSRGPWLALMLGSAALFFLGPRRIRGYLLGIAVLSMAVLITRPGVWHTIDNYYMQTISPSSPLGKSYGYRYALGHVSRTAVDIDMSHALWGYGMGSFFYLNLESYFDGRLYKFQSCDSTWIEFLVETGYVGLFLMILLLLKAALIPWSDYRRLPEPEKFVSLVLFIGIAAYYFAMLSVNLYSWGQEGYMLWVMIALGVVHNRLSHGPKARVNGLDNRNSSTHELSGNRQTLAQLVSG